MNERMLNIEKDVNEIKNDINFLKEVFEDTRKANVYWIENIKEETEADYMQKVDEIIEYLNDKIKKDYINILISRNYAEILIAYLNIQKDLVQEMLKWIKTGNDFSDVSAKYKTEEEIMEYFLVNYMKS